MSETVLIKHTIFHTLNYLVIELMRRAYQLAMTDELKNLDGLVDTRLDKWMRSDEEELIVIDDDMELLSTVEDPYVKIVVESMNKILENNKIFQMLQNMDFEDALRDTEATQEAAGILSTYILKLSDEDNYKDIMDDLDACYTSVFIILYHCIMMLDLDRTEVWEEGMNSWTSSYDRHGFDYEPKNSSGELLLELKNELMKDAVRLSEYE